MGMTKKKSNVLFESVETTASKGPGSSLLNPYGFVKNQLKPVSLPKWAMVRTEELSHKLKSFQNKKIFFCLRVSSEVLKLYYMAIFENLNK